MDDLFDADINNYLLIKHTEDPDSHRTEDNCFISYQLQEVLEGTSSKLYGEDISNICVINFLDCSLESSCTKSQLAPTQDDGCVFGSKRVLQIPSEDNNKAPGNKESGRPIIQQSDFLDLENTDFSYEVNDFLFLSGMVDEADCGINHKSKLYSCGNCDVFFRRRRELKAHLNKPHQGNFICRNCRKEFDSKINLMEHLSNKIPKLHRCNKCEEVFDEKFSMEMHKKFEHMRMLLCMQCGENFDQSGALHYHKKTKHRRKSETFSCHVCDKIYHSSHSLVVHLRDHTGERPFKCTYCAETFKSSPALYCHLRSSHSITRPFKCNVCERTFKRLDLLKGHRVRHYPRFRFECQQCQKKFKTKKARTKHTAEKHSNI